MIIGLTGKSCSGKNFASEYMKSLGWKVLDLDVLGHNLLEEKKDEIENLFGTSNRKDLGKIVFSNPEKRTLLESVLYPSIIDIVVLEASKNPIVVANGALIHRAGLDKLCKYVIYMDSSYPVRCKRACQRDKISEEAFKLRDEAQNDVSYKDVTYDAPVVIVDNEMNGTEQLKEVCKKISLGQDIL